MIDYMHFNCYLLAAMQASNGVWNRDRMFLFPADLQIWESG